MNRLLADIVHLIQTLTQLPLDEKLSILSQVAMWFTIYLVYRQLREIELQRKTTYRPDLVLGNVDIYGYSVKLLGITPPILWARRHLTNAEVRSARRSDDPFLTIHNLGFGSAKNIRITFEYEYQQYNEQLQAYSTLKNLPIDSFLRLNELVIDQPSAIKEIFPKREHKPATANQYIDYVLPAEVSPQGQALKLPVYFQTYVSLLTYMRQLSSRGPKRAIGKGADGEFEIDLSKGFVIDPAPNVDIPELEVRLQYMDVGRNAFSKAFVGKCRFVVLYSPPRSRNLAFHAVLEFSEKVTMNSKTR